jgi:hypothetical protein
MKKVSAVLTAALLAGGLTTAAFADHNKNEASMRGTINSIDHSTGKIELKTDKGASQLYFTPDAVKNFKEGEQVMVELETPGHEAMEKHAMAQKR